MFPNLILIVAILATLPFLKDFVKAYAKSIFWWALRVACATFLIWQLVTRLPNFPLSSTEIPFTAIGGIVVVTFVLGSRLQGFWRARSTSAKQSNWLRDGETVEDLSPVTLHTLATKVEKLVESSLPVSGATAKQTSTLAEELRPLLHLLENLVVAFREANLPKINMTAAEVPPSPSSAPSPSSPPTPPSKKPEGAAKVTFQPFLTEEERLVALRSLADLRKLWNQRRGFSGSRFDDEDLGALTPQQVTFSRRTIEAIVRMRKEACVRLRQGPSQCSKCGRAVKGDHTCWSPAWSRKEAGSPQVERLFFSQHNKGAVSVFPKKVLDERLVRDQMASSAENTALLREKELLEKVTVPQVNATMSEDYPFLEARPAVEGPGNKRPGKFPRGRRAAN